MRDNAPNSWESRADTASLYGFTDLPSVHAHHALLDALRARDGAAAKTALALDINSAAEVILSGTGLRDG